MAVMAYPHSILFTRNKWIAAAGGIQETDRERDLKQAVDAALAVDSLDVATSAQHQAVGPEMRKP